MSKVTESATFENMLQAAEIVRNFSAHPTRFIRAMQASFRQTGMLVTGSEGSSKKFPGQNLAHNALSTSWDNTLVIRPLNASDAALFPQQNATVVLLSYSGTTYEVLNLARMFKERNHRNMFAITATPGSELGKLCSNSYILSCGQEAVAATKSAVEQALILQRAFLAHFPTAAELKAAGDSMKRLLSADDVVDPRLMDRFAKAGTIYIAGPNNGVGDELSLKFSETCTRAVFHAGTDIIHGYQETMDENDAVILVEPNSLYQEKFKDVLEKKCKLPVLAISREETLFPTVKIPAAMGLNGYFQLAVGWRILTELAERKGVDLDHPVRVGKFGFPDPALAAPA